MRIYKVFFCVLTFIFCAGIHTSGVNQSICQPGSKIVFYPGGALKSCVLEDFFRVDGIECIKQSHISFYEDGQIEMCILSRETTIDGQKCRKMEPASFYPGGEFRSCVKQE